MSMVVIAEKPSVASDIAKVLGATSRREGFFQGKDVVVTWALGHLVQLAMPHDIHPAWKRWSADTLPMLPERFPLVPRDTRAQAQLRVIGKLVRERGTKLIVNAADAGREGELIFRYIMEALGCKKPCKRLWISSLTPDEIRKGLERLRPSAEFDALGLAARARSEADWLVGMNLSRALRLSTGDAFTVGRVQTPTLAMIVARDAAVHAHVPIAYDEVQAQFDVVLRPAVQAVDDSFQSATGTVSATYVRLCEDQDGKPGWDARLWRDRTGAGACEDPALIAARARLGVAAIRSVERESRPSRPPQLFDLTTLQRVTNQRWGWSAALTLKYAQQLYEEHKVLSYPRTDSRHLSVAVAATLGPIVAMLRPAYRDLLVPETGSAALSRRFVDDKQVSDHHALIPTLMPPTSLAEGSDLWKLYDLVCRRVLCAWQPDYVEAVTEVGFSVTHGESSDRYVARGADVVAVGWRALEPKQSQDEVPRLPPGLRAGLSTHVQDVQVVQKKTRAPSHHTEGSLLGAMENPAGVVEREHAAALKDCGLGTPATRAAIIETLITRCYVARDGKLLRATELGCALVDAVHDLIKSPALTGEWEARLRRIERSEESYENFMNGVGNLVRLCIDEAFGRQAVAS